jgi:hypothetical protein
MGPKYIVKKIGMGFALGIVGFNVLVFIFTSREYSEHLSAITVILLAILFCVIQLMNDD